MGSKLKRKGTGAGNPAPAKSPKAEPAGKQKKRVKKPASANKFLDEVAKLRGSWPDDMANIFSSSTDEVRAGHALSCKAPKLLPGTTALPEFWARRCVQTLH